jgi:hypothetical protein
MLSGHLSNGDALFTFCLQHLPKLRKLSASAPFPGASLYTLRIAIAAIGRTLEAVLDELFCELDNAIKFRQVLNSKGQFNLLKLRKLAPIQFSF